MIHKRGAIFDLDGTLLDSMWVWQQIDIDFLGKRGFEVPDDYLQHINPLGFTGAAEYTIQRFGLSEKPEDLIEEWYEMAREKYAKHVLLKPHAGEYLAFLHACGVQIGAATSSAKELLLPCLERNGILQYFETVVTTMEVGKGKDFPNVYLEAARQIQVPIEECIVYEDILKGILSARAAGCAGVVAMRETASDCDAQEIRQEADFYITDFAELIEHR